jgi:hypothetical protein
MNTIIDTKEFIFNEREYFTNLIQKENLSPENNEEYLNMIGIKDDIYKFVYQKDDKGLDYCHCYKNDNKINWDDIGNWLRPYVWEFEKENKIL